jgi:hypothetical protein
MKTIFIDYPIDFSFKTKKTFTTNEERTQHLQQVLRRKKVESPSHDYSDYVVEGIEVSRFYGNDEFWIVGS